MEKEKDCCKNCEYYDSVYEEGETSGYCRRFPPMFIMDSNGDFIGKEYNFLPISHDCTWCGEWKGVK
jgi:hypothetical protein